MGWRAATRRNGSWISTTSTVARVSSSTTRSTATLEAGRYLRHYVVEVNGQIVRLALEDLTILHDMELEEAPRLIFGARLASCEIEDGGGWVIHFEPRSGVLLTDADAVQSASSVLLDPGLKATLERQQQWLDKHLGEPLERP